MRGSSERISISAPQFLHSTILPTSNNFCNTKSSPQSRHLVLVDVIALYNIKMVSELQETPIKEVEGVLLKLEYKNPTGSVKDRGVPFQIGEAVKNGFKKFVISSSGNAAISAAFWTQKMGLGLVIFVSPNVSRGKLKRLKTGNSKVFVDRRPISGAIRYAKKEKAFNLRASTDPNGFVGYESLSFELKSQMGEVGSIFVPVSSGTLCYGLFKGFEKLSVVPQVHCVQTTSCNLISSKFDSNFNKTSSSLADALVAKTSVLEESVTSLIRKSEGFGWVVEDREIKKAWNYLKEHGLITSYEGAAALASVWKARERDFKLKDPIICLLTGRYYR